jgi:hypothetical protein
MFVFRYHLTFRLSAGPANGQTLSCAAKAHVPKPKRHAACLHVSRAMQAA